jgi:CTP synthase
MQMAAIEFARHVSGLDGANSTEVDPRTPNPIFDLMPDQRDLADMGGTMRLGLYPCRLVPGTRAACAYGEPLVYERHRHRFEFNNAYRAVLEEAGLVAIEKGYAGRRPRTWVHLTPQGRAALDEELRLLRRLLEGGSGT